MALVPTAASIDPAVVYRDWIHSHFFAGLLGVGIGAPDDGDPVPPSGLGPISLQRIPFVADQCRRRIEFDLLYSPSEVRVGIGGDEVVVPFTFQAELFNSANTKLATRTVTSPSHGYSLGTVAEPGDYRVDLYLLQGADVAWDLRIRGFQALGEPTCRVTINEIEANPYGTDSGAEWLELFNGDLNDADVSGWTLRATHGQPASLSLPTGSVVPAGGFLVVTFASQFLDNDSEIVQLEDPLGNLMESVGPFNDGENDNRTQQRVPDGTDSWRFRAGTGNSTNGA